MSPELRAIEIRLYVTSQVCEPSPIAQDLRTGGRWFDAPAWPISFLRTDDNYGDRIYFSLTAFYCFDNGFVERQPVHSTGQKKPSKVWIGVLAAAID